MKKIKIKIKIYQMLKSQPFLKLGVKLSINHLYHTLQKSEPSVRGTAFITCLEDYF